MYDKKSREKMAQEVIRELHAAEPHFYRGNDLRHAASPWCCEATLGALQTITPMKIDRLEEITFGLGGGFSKQGEVCGVVTGHIIAIGLDVVSRIRETARIRQEISAETIKFCERFRKKFGSIRCKDLIGYDLSDPEQLEASANDKKRQKLCDDLMVFAIVDPLPFEQEGFKRDVLGV